MKKGAYDLGRKALYYIIVMIIIAVLFTYMLNSVRKYQITNISNLDKVTDLVMVQNVIKCVSQKDAETGKISLGKIDEAKLKQESLVECLGKKPPYSDKAVKLEIKNIKLETQTPYFEYTKYKRKVIYQDKEEELKINIERYPRIQ